MKVIYKKAGEGRTTELVRISAETGKYIVVKDYSDVRNVTNIAHREGLNIPYPCTYHEVMKNPFIRNQGVLIDNPERILQDILGVPIIAMSVQKPADEE